jgi:hypothetical protein
MPWTTFGERSTGQSWRRSRLWYAATCSPSFQPLKKIFFFITFFWVFSVNETAVIRWDYGDPTLGTCKETIQGGNHFRYWMQTGSLANRCVLVGRSLYLPLMTNVFSLPPSLISGAIFMAVSYELPDQRAFVCSSLSCCAPILR